ncbi:MAG: PAS domain-containing protein [Maritimibacter sp.]|nr:PAS domain-containing protein [Maritimibacter sp.]
MAPRAAWLLVIGVVLLAGAWVSPMPALAIGLIVAALTFVTLAVLVKALAFNHVRAEAAFYDTIAEFVAFDAAPSFTADRDGQIGYVNGAGRERFGDVVGATLLKVFGDMFASPGTVLYRLQNKALAMGAAREDVVLKRGHMRLSVHRVGQGGFLWRLEDIGEGTPAGRSGEHISLPMMTVSKSGTILFMNEALRRMLGGRETTLDRVFTDLPLRPGTVHHVAAAHRAEPVQVIEAALSGGRRELYLAPSPFQIRVTPGEWGVVDRLPVPLLRLDQSGQVTMANQRARALLGTDEVVGRYLSDLVEDLGRPISDWLREAWQGRNLRKTETVRATNTEERFVQISLEQFEDENGQALVAVLNDATELKTLETQFVQSQKMQAIGQLAGSVAHDFNNLLTAISGHCDLLLLKRDARDPDFADLDQIAQNANRAAALVGQLLDYSRKQRLRPEVLDLEDVMGDVAHLLRRLVGERVQIDLAVEPNIQAMRADKRKLEQVIVNLVVNARDAMMPAGGEIKIRLSNLFLARPLARDGASVPAGDYVQIQVIDEGSGIADDKLGRIFEPFFSTKGQQGTGLGLSTVYGIVKQSGGFIFVDTVVGSGTTFSLFFPVFREDVTVRPPEPAPAPDYGKEPALIEPGPTAGALGHANTEPRFPAAPTPVVNAPQGQAGGTVLLVEDEAGVRAFASKALGLRGFTVLEAETAEDALAMLQDPALNVDVFVTDVVLPEMDGPTWVGEALKTRPGARVVFVSGYSVDSVSEHRDRIANAVFLPKPFSLTDLTEVVTRQMPMSASANH